MYRTKIYFTGHRVYINIYIDDKLNNKHTRDNGIMKRIGFSLDRDQYIYQRKIYIYNRIII